MLRARPAPAPTPGTEPAPNPTAGAWASPWRGPGVLLVVAVALARADGGLVGAVAPALRHDLGINDARLGLLASLASVSGAVCALPAGRLVDRRSRRVVLGLALVGWSLALGVAGVAAGVALFALARLVSGALSTVARPAAVSLLAEHSPPLRRGRALAFLDAGQSAGAALCYLVVAAALAVSSWRAAFLGLAAAGVVLAAFATRLPAGSGHPGPGADEFSLADVVRVPTNLAVLAAESVGNFFFAGASSFSVLLVTERFGLSAVTVDALAPALGLAVIGGIFAGGKMGDAVAARGGGVERLVLACVCIVVAAALMLPALLSPSLVAAACLLTLGATLLGAAGPLLDTVRVEVMPASLRGRAEAARGLLLLGSTAAAPITFGLVATALGGHPTHGSGLDHGAGIDHAFLVMLVPLAVSGLMLLPARGSYRRDAAAVRAAEEVVPA